MKSITRQGGIGNLFAIDLDAVPTFTATLSS